MTAMTPEEIAEVDRRFSVGEEVWMWCLHHEQHYEQLTELLSTRIAYIMAYKNAEEIPIRLREIQAVKNPSALWALIPVRDAAMIEPTRVRDAAMADANLVCDAVTAEPSRVWDAAMVAANRSWKAATAEANLVRDEAIANLVHDARVWDATKAAMIEATRVFDAAMAEATRVREAAMVEPNRVRMAAMIEPDRAWYAAMVAADAPIAALHRSEYPNTAWNGLSIFAADLPDWVRETNGRTSDLRESC